MEAISADSGSRLSPDVDHFHADQRHLSLSSRRKCASSKKLYQCVLYCGVSDARSISYLQSMVQRVAKSLAVPNFHAGFYQATQLNSIM
jgi:hypothetical protein